MMENPTTGIEAVTKILIANGVEPERVQPHSRLSEDLGFCPWQDYPAIAADIKVSSGVDLLDDIVGQEVTVQGMVDMVMERWRKSVSRLASLDASAKITESMIFR